MVLSLLATPLLTPAVIQFSLASLCISLLYPNLTPASLSPWLRFVYSEAEAEGETKSTLHQDQQNAKSKNEFNLQYGLIVPVLSLVTSNGINGQNGLMDGPISQICQIDDVVLTDYIRGTLHCTLPSLSPTGRVVYIYISVADVKLWYLAADTLSTSSNVPSPYISLPCRYGNPVIGRMTIDPWDLRTCTRWAMSLAKT
jgi:hypothetical protein